ncbi:MAG: hypothetical protein JJ714_05455 [Acidithiobacillus sp.]|nr:hypothetical protein [Acidithiobacillus sp.]
MSIFLPKAYQQRVLDSVEAYFKACHELLSPSLAFTATTEGLCVGPKVIYATACRLSSSRLARAGITFKQMPYVPEV